MRKHTLLIAGLMAGASLIPLVAHADDTVSTASSQDQLFATAARQGNQTEIITSQTAEDRTSNPEIKAFAKRMISDHTYIDGQLKKAVENTNVSLPDDFDGPHQAVVDNVKEATDADFNRDYLMAQDKAHKEAIAAFQTEAETGSNPHLKSFAAQTLPILEEHQAMLMKIEQSPQFASIMPPAPGTTETTITTTTTTAP